MIIVLQVISKDSVRSLIVPQNQPRENPPLILSRREFDKILNAAKVKESKRMNGMHSHISI